MDGSRPMRLCVVSTSRLLDHILTAALEVDVIAVLALAVGSDLDFHTAFFAAEDFPFFRRCGGSCVHGLLLRVRKVSCTFAIPVRATDIPSRVHDASAATSMIQGQRIGGFGPKLVEKCLRRPNKQDNSAFRSHRKSLQGAKLRQSDVTRHRRPVAAWQCPISPFASWPGRLAWTGQGPGRS